MHNTGAVSWASGRSLAHHTQHKCMLHTGSAQSGCSVASAPGMFCDHRFFRAVEAASILLFHDPRAECSLGLPDVHLSTAAYDPVHHVGLQSWSFTLVSSDGQRVLRELAFPPPAFDCKAELISRQNQL